MFCKRVKQTAQRHVNLYCRSVNSHSHLVCELSCDVAVMQSLRVAQELAVRGVHDGDAELYDVLLIVLL